MTSFPEQYGLRELVKTNANLVCQGSLEDCRKMAFAHGLSIGVAERDRYLLSPRGLIQSSFHGWILVIDVDFLKKY